MSREDAPNQLECPAGVVLRALLRYSDLRAGMAVVMAVANNVLVLPDGLSNDASYSYVSLLETSVPIGTILLVGLMIKFCTAPAWCGHFFYFLNIPKKQS